MKITFTTLINFGEAVSDVLYHDNIPSVMWQKLMGGDQALKTMNEPCLTLNSCIHIYR